MSEAYIAGPGATMPAPDGGPPFTSTRVTALRAGNEYLDRDDGGTVRTVAKVQTVIRVVFDPLPGAPAHRDHILDLPADVHAWGRKGVPGRGHRTPTAVLEQSWEDADLKAAERGH